MTDQVQFELGFRAHPGQIVSGVRGKRFIEEPERAATLPEIPPQFEQMTGDYPTVSKRAVELNEAQTRSGFQHWIFFPETISKDGARYGARA
ncbi:hypothetical protein QWJ90_01405 [Microbacterium oryzae]|uniref:hypothetical protein n=1 Tax=Microbacterium oryzae TaxID=743009 RepID=UPI0025B097DB|nr:hypothetical protein [Microbacterium oryzae]MDN3309579.1 hypothetical protein [Microbacterium oryzae]